MRRALLLPAFGVLFGVRRALLGVRGPIMIAEPTTREVGVFAAHNNLVRGQS